MAKVKSITTKVGDQGRTFLFSGEKVFKNSPRLETYGDVDELVSILGIARHQAQKPSVKEAILSLQRALFTVAAELATSKSKLNKLKKRVDETFLKDLEEKRTALESMITIPNDFIVPANTLAAATIDLARTVARRCERKVVFLHDKKFINNPLMIIWFNRLSDYLYLLARDEEGSPLMR